MQFFKKIFGDENQREIEALKPLISKINSLEQWAKSIKTKEDFRIETEKLKKRISNGESLDDILAEAFALVREASVRTLGQRHFDVQLLGGMILHHRGI